jgi:hypothetical protein
VKRKGRRLAVCKGGNVRSATLARMLRRRRFEALNCGVDGRYSDETLLMLFNWAEYIFIQRDAAEMLGKRPGWKVLMAGSKGAFYHHEDGRSGWLDFRFDVGPDVWRVPDHPDLLSRLDALFKAKA